MRRAAVLVVLVVASFLFAVPAKAAQPVVWVFGHSIPAGVWLGAGESWPDRFAQLTGAKVRVFAVGGAVFDAGGRVVPHGQVVSDQVRDALARFPGERPSRVFVDAGVNDLVTHSDLSDVFWAVINVDLLLQSRGVHGTYMTVLPMGFGSSHPDYWVPVLTARARVLNGWLRAMTGAFPVADMAGVLHEGADGVVGAPWLLLDGLHPNRDAAVMVAARLADL